MIKSQISACSWQLGRHQRFSAATKSAAQTWRERERLATKFLLIYKSCSHLENISFDSLSLFFFFSPSIIPRWVPRKNQMNFHEMQEKKEKAISLPPNSERCHKQLNESSSNEFQLKDIFSERSQVHLYSRQVKVETFGKSTQRTLTPCHAAQIVECSQF